LTHESRPRFEGAITTPDEIPDQSAAPPAERPRRPILIEIASAILIVGGLTSLVGVFSVTGLLQVLVVAIDLLTIVVGILIRSGRGWVLALNVVVIAIFLEATAISTSFGILFLVLDSIVLFALLRHRAWFDWRPDDSRAPA
jgi:hypothetical protein